jgi:hypothetical protein
MPTDPLDEDPSLSAPASIRPTAQNPTRDSPLPDRRTNAGNLRTTVDQVGTPDPLVRLGDGASADALSRAASRV